VQPAQTTPPQHPSGKPGPSVPERRATPEVPGKLKPGEHPAASAPSPQTAPQAGSPRERGKPAAATPPTPKQNVGNVPAGTLAAPTVVRRAPPPPGNPTAVPPPTQVINKGQFLALKGQTPTVGINQVRSERREEHVGNQLIIREPGRTIVQEGNRTFIRHSEVDRFVVGARNVHVERRGNETVTVVVRPDNVQIIDYSDSDGRLLRRVRRGPDGREIVIIDNGFAGAQLANVFLSLTAPVIRIPRDRYIVDADRADEAAIYGVLVAPPIERIDRRYTLDQVRYNEPLRAYMPRLDLEVNFDTGSWQLTPDQVDRLSAIAEALNRAIQRNPREVFLIEGYTDAVGSDVDNLSLSDRRAESVAVALTEQFQVPAENLSTQGYGRQFLKVPTSGPERANRRVAIRRITPLVDPDAVSQR
jgi:outer membrane protein OmpA-like peptidoglycan-associated protein